MSKALVLLSGGLDSVTALYEALNTEDDQVFALTLDYGQLHRREIDSAIKITSFLEIQHQILRFEMPWKGSALLDKTIELPKSGMKKKCPQAFPHHMCRLAIPFFCLSRPHMLKPLVHVLFISEPTFWTTADILIAVPNIYGPLKKQCVWEQKPGQKAKRFRLKLRSFSFLKNKLLNGDWPWAFRTNGHGPAIREKKCPAENVIHVF